MDTIRVTGLGFDIEKQVLKKGKFGKKPSIGWSCSITLQTQNPSCQKSLEMTIGNACNAKERFLEYCVQSMHLEEQSLFTGPLEGSEEITNVTITLNSFVEKPYIFQWSEEEKFEASNYYKAKGTELYKANEIQEAFYKFSLALKFTNLLDTVLEQDEPHSEISDLRVTLYNNLANCHLNFKNYDSVVKLCSNSIDLTPTSKALYRRALAYVELKEYEKAESDLVELLKLEPKNKAALEKYKLVRDLDKTNRDNYTNMVKKMFS